MDVGAVSMTPCKPMRRRSSDDFDARGLVEEERRSGGARGGRGSPRVDSREGSLRDGKLFLKRRKSQGASDSGSDGGASNSTTRSRNSRKGRGRSWDDPKAKEAAEARRIRARESSEIAGSATREAIESAIAVPETE